MRSSSVAMLILTLLLSSCGPTEPTERAGALDQPAYGGMATYVIEDDVLDFDPLTSRGVTDREVQYEIYDSLSHEPYTFPTRC